MNASRGMQTIAIYNVIVLPGPKFNDKRELEFVQKVGFLVA